MGFRKHLFPKPEDYNVADWILQVAQTNSIEALEKLGFFGAHEPNNTSVDKTQPDEVMTPAGAHVGFATQIRLLFKRELRKLFRDKFGFVVKVASNLAFGQLFGFIFLGVGRSSYVLPPEINASFGAMANLLISTMFGV